jgi:ribonucleotide reductase alpha subunit
MSKTLSHFANTIWAQKYAKPGETWEDNGPGSLSTARRVVENVMGPYFPQYVEEMVEAVTSRKFMPGGRYLYATGQRFHQTQNCLLLKVEDSRESISELMMRVSSGLMTGAGIGIVWSQLREDGALVKGMGGKSTGPLAFMQMVNEIGRHVMQGGSRRAAIWAGLHWYHPDVFKFIHMKDWSEDLKAMKVKDFNSYAPMDMTNISVILDDDFFAAYDDPDNDQHEWANLLYWEVIGQMLLTGEPGFSIDVGENAGENLRNAPVTAGTHVLTDIGYRKVADLVDHVATVWTGKRWAEDVKFLRTGVDSDIVKVTMTGGREIRCEPNHEFLVERYSGAGVRRQLVLIDRIKASHLQVDDILHTSFPLVSAGERHGEAYTLGWLYGDGSFSTRNNTHRAELTLCSDESKACLPYIVGYDSVNMSDGRGFVRVYWHDGFEGHRKERAPLIEPLQVASFVAGLFDADGNWEPVQKRVRLASKHQGFLRDVARMLEGLGIVAHVSKAGTSTYGQSQGYQLVVASEYSALFASLIPTVRVKPDLTDYSSYRHSLVKVLSVTPDGVEDVYCADVQQEEHSFMAEGVIISNCTEVTSYDDNDICNLGSINMAEVEDIHEFKRLVELGTVFLLCGTLYSLVPFQGVDDTRTKNRRLGLGLMGIYEWLVTRGKAYAEDSELAEWLDEYAKSTDIAAIYAAALGISAPLKTRAIAPTGTIGILAETTTGIEPLFAVAMKRRYLKGQEWHFQYIVDATAQRLIDKGVDPNRLETAYDLAQTPERRIAFQAWVQQWVDHGISSTLNLPAHGTHTFTNEEFGEMLMGYLPALRGVTVYPDGARGGQPLNVVPYDEAKDWVGYEYQEFGSENACVSGVCGV